MKIGFLLCSPDINGGTNVILEHVAGLQKRGHEVCIITERYVTPEEYEWHPRGNQLTWCTFEQANTEQFDCLIATWWESPYLLHQFDAKQYVYFVQSIESRFFKAEDPTSLDLRDHSIGADRSEHSYFFALPTITEATWIKHYLERNFNQHPYLVRNGIWKELYAGNVVIQKKPREGLRVLIEGPVDVFHKNVPRTIALCREAGVAEIWLLTSSQISDFDGVDRVFSRIPLEQTPPIYRSCHLLVKLSSVEGMFGPPLEMFHCGGTAIVYDVTGHDEYIEHDGNSLIAKKGDEEQVVEYLRRLSKDRDYLNHLCEGAQKTAAAWHDWQHASLEFENTLNEVMKLPGVSRDYLENLSRIFNSYQSLQLESRELQRHAEREGSDTQKAHHNFIQAYAIANDKIIDQTWCHFTSGEITTLMCELITTGAEIQIRLDPSVRIGIVCLYKIEVKNSQKDEIAIYTPRNFAQLFLTGTGLWLEKLDDYWVVNSYGNDPQIILPLIQTNDRSSLKLEITLCELGISQYILKQKERVHSCDNKGLLSSLRKLVAP